MKTHESRRRQFSGSFGIPPEMQEARKTFEEKKAAAEAAPGPDDAEEENEGPGVVEDEGPDTGMGESDKPGAAFAPGDVTKLPPRKALESLGVKLEDQDFHSILYRGYVEKDVEIMPALGGVKAMVVKLKTLTPEEYNLIDELLAEDLDAIKGTNLGFQARRELWTISFAVLDINGRELGKVKREKDGSVDLKELARSRHKMLSQLSPAVINKIIKINSTMNWAITAIVEDPKSNF